MWRGSSAPVGAVQALLPPPPPLGASECIDQVWHDGQQVNSTGNQPLYIPISSRRDVHTTVEHPNQELDMITVQEPLDEGLKLSMAGTFSQSLPTIDPPLLYINTSVAWDDSPRLVLGGFPLGNGVAELG